MRRSIIRIGAVTIILLMLSSLAVGESLNRKETSEPSFATRLIRWLRNSISMFRLRGQTTDNKQNGDTLRPRAPVSPHPRAPAAPRSTQAASLAEFYNYPNPFIPDLGTDFVCKMEGEATLELKIYDMNGSMVKQLSWESSQEPPHWDGKDTIGGKIRTGMYIYSLKITDAITGEVSDSRYGKMMAWYMD